MSNGLEAAKEQFAHHMQRALGALYDPAALIHNPLIGVFDLGRQTDPVAALRRLFIDAIESLKPDELAPLGSRGWRVFQVLHRRYAEQILQHEVAVNLGLSIRQLQREEKIAREVLAERLWVTHNLSTREHLLMLPNPILEDKSTQQANAPSTDAELKTLSDSTSNQIVNLDEVIQEIIDTVQPLLSKSKTFVEFQKADKSSYISVKVPMLRQALVNLVSMALGHTTGGRLLIRTYHTDTRVSVDIQIMKNPGSCLLESRTVSEMLEITNQLLAFCHSELFVETHSLSSQTNSALTELSVFAGRVDFQIADTLVVMVIDDNADTRHLLQRYLQGTLYQFVGIEDAQLALAIAEQIKPHAIILDVMMPKRDGWTLLEQLRKHDALQEIPIIVSTILPQKELAIALGASEFIRKPVKRPEFLAALARHLAIHLEPA